MHQVNKDLAPAIVEVLEFHKENLSKKISTLPNNSDEASVLTDELKLVEKAKDAPNVPLQSNYDSKPKVQDQPKQTLK